MSWLRGKPQDKPRHYRKGRIGRLSGVQMAELRFQCFLRDNFTCCECGEPVLIENVIEISNPRRAHMAHIKSRGAGGTDTLDNVRTLCGRCHGREHNGVKPCPPKPRMESQW